MQEVTQKQLQGYTKTLNNVADEARSQYSVQLKAYAQKLGDFSTWDKETKRAFQDYAAEQMQENGRIFCNASVSSAKKFANDVLNADWLKNYGDEIDYIPKASAKKSAHYWATTHLFSDEPSLDSFIDGCCSKLERNVVHAADIYVSQGSVRANKNSKRKSLKFARVPQGPTCPFCIMLASRGFVYASAASAGEFSKYHDKCDCRILAGYEGLQVENYDYEGMAARYGQCRKAIWDNLPDQLEWLKSKQGLEYTEKYGSEGAAWNKYTTECILDEMDTRDRKWLFDGTVPKVEYKPKEYAEMVREHEQNTAKILAYNHGIACVFRPDELLNVGEKGNTIGLADLENGYELKTLLKEVKQSTIDGYIRNANHKQGLKAVVFDNLQNWLPNEKCKKYIIRSRQCDVPVYLLNNTKLEKIK